MNNKKLSTADLELILENRMLGYTPVESAKILGCSAATVSYQLRVFDSVRKEDWSKTQLMLENGNIGKDIVIWAAGKLGKEIPDGVLECPKRKSHKPKTTQAEPDIVPAIATVEKDNEALVFIKILEALNRQNELLEQLYDVVLPKWVGDLKDNMNANCDMINQGVKRCEDKLEAVKINVRKRGM